jgi:hypothetical protein
MCLIAFPISHLPQIPLKHPHKLHLPTLQRLLPQFQHKLPKLLRINLQPLKTSQTCQKVHPTRLPPYNFLQYFVRPCS